MTVILGMHFGHDANISIFKNGKQIAYALRERVSRIKHAYSLDRATLDYAFCQAGIRASDIDFCALTSTQGCDATLVKMDHVSLHYSDIRSSPFSSPLAEYYAAQNISVQELCAPSMLERVLSAPRDPKTHEVFVQLFEEYKHYALSDLQTVEWLEAHYPYPSWNDTSGLDQLCALDVHPILQDNRLSRGFHYPMLVTIDSIDIPGVRIDHHLAHAASSYYRSSFTDALVITNDGYGGDRTLFSNGGVYVGKGNRLSPVWPHRMFMGQIFHHVGMEVGFDALGAAGKLMGLAPYGQPRLFDSQWVGNTSDLIERGLTPTPEGWVDHVAAKADELQYDRDAPSLKHIPFNRYQIDLAASTQYLFEKQWQALVKAACAMMAGNGLSYDNLCLSGGASLNCPSNSAIVRNTNIRNLFIEPSCDDSGLSIGAALWLHYDLMENPYNESARFTQKDVYAGRSYTDAEVLNALQAVAEQVEYEKRDNQCERAAEDLAGRSIIGWFQGGSEQGPRALGHRSLLALPVDKQMHQRVNALKNREQWRPLAPAVLEEKYRTTFHDLPNCSPFMLQTGISAKSQQYPAITHIDGSARVQTVHPEMGEFYNLLNCLYRISGHPLVLNTSMNGPGEPIVETPDNALQFLLNSDLEVLYLQGYRVTKVEPKPSQGS